MKHFFVFSVFAIALNSWATDVMPFDLQAAMLERAKETVFRVCGGEEKTSFPNSAQIHNSYNKFDGDADEGGVRYYYAPLMTGAAYCKANHRLVQWTVTSDIIDGKLDVDRVLTTLSAELD